jgi:hypothetical protein
VEEYFRVVMKNDMQDYIFVIIVLLMIVSVPVGCSYMKFDISPPKRISDVNPRVEKVGACVVVMQSGVHNSHALLAACFELVRFEPSEFPNLMEEIFAHFEGF